MSESPGAPKIQTPRPYPKSLSLIFSGKGGGRRGCSLGICIFENSPVDPVGGQGRESQPWKRCHEEPPAGPEETPAFPCSFTRVSLSYYSPCPLIASVLANGLGKASRKKPTSDPISGNPPHQVRSLNSVFLEGLGDGSGRERTPGPQLEHRGFTERTKACKEGEQAS